MAREQKWVNFTYDPDNSFHNLIIAAEGCVDQEDMDHFLFHQLRTSFDDGVLKENRDPKGSLRVMNVDAAKIVKGRKKGILSGILYLAAGDSAGIEVCPNRTGKFPTWRHKEHPGSNIVFGAKNKHGQCVTLKNGKFHLSDPERADEFMQETVKKANSMQYIEAVSYLAKLGFSKDAGCSGLCLGHTAGHARVAQSKKDDLASNPVQSVRIERTKRLLAMGEEENQKFLNDVVHDIKAIIRKAEREGMTPAVRLNGTSDLYWHSMPKLKKEGKTIFEMFPDTQFYDYTKNFDVVMNFLDGKLPKNYHVTYSFGGSNWPLAKKILDKGGNVAVGFRLRKKDDFPIGWRGYEVIDGDETDLRFADPTSVPGKIVGLRTKGSSFSMDSEFIVEPDDPEIVWPEDSPFHEKQGRKGAQEIKKTRAEREVTASKYIVANQIEQDLYQAFEMIYDGKGLTLNDVQKRTKIPVQDLKMAYDHWSRRFQLTDRDSKMLPTNADRALVAKNIKTIFQMLSRRAIRAGAYEPSKGMQGADLRNYIKGQVKNETFAEYVGMDHLSEATEIDAKNCPQWNKLSQKEKNALDILVKQHNEDPRSWKVALGLAPGPFDALVRRGIAEKQTIKGTNSYRVSCSTLLGEATEAKPLSDLQQQALKILKNQYERARKPGFNISMQWVAPSDYDMKAATFEFLCKRGLAERKMNPGKGSNRWYYRWVKPLNEVMEKMTFSTIGKVLNLVMESPMFIGKNRKPKDPVRVTINAKDDIDTIEKKMVDACYDAMSVTSEREDFDVDYVPYGEIDVPMGSKGSVLTTTVRQERPIEITVNGLKDGDEIEELIPEDIEIEIETDAGSKTIRLSTEGNRMVISFGENEFEQNIED
jgi:hypothetical protein